MKSRLTGTHFIYVKQEGCKSDHYKLHTVGLHGRKLPAVLDKSMSDCGMVRTWSTFWRPGWQPNNVQRCNKCLRSRESIISVENERTTQKYGSLAFTTGFNPERYTYIVEGVSFNHVTNYQKEVTEMKERELTELVRRYEQLLKDTADLKQRIVDRLKGENITRAAPADVAFTYGSGFTPAAVTMRTMRTPTFEEQVLEATKNIGGNVRAADVAKLLNIKQHQGVHYCLAHLVKRGLLTRVNRGTYAVKVVSKQPARKTGMSKPAGSRRLTEGSTPWKIVRLLNGSPSRTFDVTEIASSIGTNNYDSIRLDLSRLTRSLKILKVGRGSFKAKFNSSFISGRTKVHEELSKQKEEKKAEILRMFDGKNVALNVVSSSIGRDRSCTTNYLNELIESGMATRITRGHYQIGRNSSPVQPEAVTQS